MAFLVDDLLATAAAGINLSDTLVRVVRNNSRVKGPGEIEALLTEVRIEAVSRIDDAHSALNRFEQLLIEKGVDLDRGLNEIIAETPFWNVPENYKLNRAKKSLDSFADSTFRAFNDIAALVRCLGVTEPTGRAAVESAGVKHDFNRAFVLSETVGEKIGLLRRQLDVQREELVQTPEPA